MSGRELANAVAGTFAAECAMRLRSPQLLVRLFAVLALCTALTPPPGAPYAIIKVGGSIPQMNASTALLAAGVVLNLLVILVFALMLDVGNARDARLRTAPLLRTQKIGPGVLVLGRVAANIAYGVGFAVIAMFVLAATLTTRYGAPPDANAFAFFFLLAVPAVITGAVQGMVIDLVLPGNPAPRVAVAVIAWTLTVAVALGGVVDFAGTATLSQTMGPLHASQSLALGLVPASGSPVFDWHIVAGDLRTIAARQSLLALALLVGGPITGLALAPLLLRRRVAAQSRPARAYRLEAYTGAGAFARPTRRMPGVGYGLTSLRLYRRSRVALLLLAAAAVIGAVLPEAAESAIALLATLPLFLFAGTSRAELAVARTIEQCEPALQLPSAALVQALAIVPPMLLAAVPALLRLPALQEVTAVSGMFLLSLWLTFTHRRLDMPLLGVSVAALALYVIVFNNPPPWLDLLGAHHANLFALTASAGCAILLAALVGRRP